MGFNLLDDEYFTIPYITDTIPNSPAGNQLPSQAKQNVWIVAINGEEPITAQGVLDELNRHQTSRGISKIKISLCRRKSYQRTDLEEIRSRFGLMTIEFIKYTLICDRIFSIDSYNPHILLSLGWKLITSWTIRDSISDVRYCKIFIIQ